jgi:hypothetical protein
MEERGREKVKKVRWYGKSERKGEESEIEIEERQTERKEKIYRQRHEEGK